MSTVPALTAPRRARKLSVAEPDRRGLAIAPSARASTAKRPVTLRPLAASWRLAMAASSVPLTPRSSRAEPSIGAAPETVRRPALPRSTSA